MPELNDYHKKVMEEKIAYVDYLIKHPTSLEQRLNQCKHLRKQRLARESKLQV